MRERRSTKTRRGSASTSPTPSRITAGNERSLPAPASVAKLAKRSLGRLPATTILVPDPDVWRISGVGRALVARRRPDGRVAWASCQLDLKRPSAFLLFGHLSSDEGEFETILENLRGIDGCAPMIAGGLSLAGRFAWGAYARGASRGYDFEELDPALLSVFDRPGSTLTEALELLEGDGAGIVDRELRAFCRREEDAALPKGESLVTLVAMGFEARRPEAIAAAFGRDPSFSLTGIRENGLELDWSPGGRSSEARGSVVIQGSRIRADAVSLDHAGQLCSALKRLADGHLELVALERRTMQDLLRVGALDQAG